jgi:hypothetical protein
MLTPRPFVKLGQLLILALPMNCAIAQQREEAATTQTTGSIRRNPPAAQGSNVRRPEAADTQQGCRPWCNNELNPCDLPEFRVPDNRCLPDW